MSPGLLWYVPESWIKVNRVQRSMDDDDGGREGGPGSVPDDMTSPSPPHPAPDTGVVDLRQPPVYRHPPQIQSMDLSRVPSSSRTSPGIRRSPSDNDDDDDDREVKRPRMTLPTIPVSDAHHRHIPVSLAWLHAPTSSSASPKPSLRLPSPSPPMAHRGPSPPPPRHSPPVSQGK